MLNRITTAAVFLGLMLFCGCNKSANEETARMKAEVEEMKRELEKTRADNRVLTERINVELEVLRSERLRNTTGGAVAPVAKSDVEAKRATMPSRLASINQISYETEKQNAYIKLAVDAAEVGSVDVAKQCIDKISYETQKQETIYKVALRFAKNGKADEALELSKKISYETQRQKLLSKLAKAEYEDN